VCVEQALRCTAHVGVVTLWTAPQPRNLTAAGTSHVVRATCVRPHPPKGLTSRKCLFEEFFFALLGWPHIVSRCGCCIALQIA